jgi:hypothetical protein
VNNGGFYTYSLLLGFFSSSIVGENFERSENNQLHFFRLKFLLAAIVHLIPLATRLAAAYN